MYFFELLGVVSSVRLSKLNFRESSLTSSVYLEFHLYHGRLYYVVTEAATGGVL